MALLARTKRFLTSRIGRIILLIIAALIAAGAYLVGGVLFSIVAALLFGLGLPIWAGASQPRYLAVVGVAILAATPAIVAAVEVPLLLAPLGPSSSAGGSAAVLQNATLSPFVGSAGSTFNWSVQIFPMFLPTGSTVSNVTLYLSTCPGATGVNSSVCSAGYPFYSYTNISGVRGITAITTFNFSNIVVPSANIWSWQMSLGYTNATGGPSYVFLVGDAQYDGIQGPITVVGWGLYGLILGSIYLQVLLYLGLSFFIVLLIYVVYKLRRQRQRENVLRVQSAAATPAPARSAEGTGTSAASAGALPSGAMAAGATRPAPTEELACPTCGAVVYAKETYCWKCGTPLGSAGKIPPPKG
ncbi:MAG: hypothetical protein ACREBT_02195 [Thermoplasmata archaeon]